MLYNVPNQNSTQSRVQYLNLNLTICTKEFIQENYGELSDIFLSTIPEFHLASKELLCLKPPENYSILNSDGIDRFQTIQFFLAQCNNKTRNNTCRPKEEINAALSNAAFNIYTPDIYFNHKNYENPGVSYINTQSFTITSSLYKRYFIYLKSIFYLSDNGLVISDMKNSTYFQLDKVNQEVFLAGVTTLVPNSIANFCFTIQTNTFNTFSRQYTNIPQILANLGGAFNLMMIICLMINYFLENVLKNIEIFNICCTEILIKKNLKTFENNMKNEIEIENHLKTNNFIKENSNKSFEKTKGLFPANDLLNQRIQILNNFEFSRKSIIFDYPEIGNLLDIKFSFFTIACPFLRNQNQKRKVYFAEKFSNQILEIDFIFGNLLENILFNLLKSQK